MKKENTLLLEELKIIDFLLLHTYIYVCIYIYISYILYYIYNIYIYYVYINNIYLNNLLTLYYMVAEGETKNKEGQEI